MRTSRTPRLARILCGATATTLLWTAAGAVQAQTYPSKPVRMIVPFAPGGTTDGIARIVAAKTSELLGQQIVVDNRAGAGGNVGTDLVAKAQPDGYTIAMVGNSFTVNPALYRAMPYKQSDLVPVVMAGKVPFVMVARPGLPYKTVAELITYARSNPGKVTYASGGSGTIGHLGAHWFGELAQLKLLHVPYRGGSQAMTDLIGGQVDIFFDTLITSTPFLKSGQIRPLFVTTEQRLENLPQVPTAAEAGFADLGFSAWVGVIAPAGTPKDIVERLNREVNAALASAEVRQKLAALGAHPMGGSTTAARDFMAAETSRWGNVVKASGAEVQ
jgi:tripartite-type tricarboxylate transporter receptor subunit TctC